MADSPVPQLNISGVDTLSNASMTKVSSTEYTYDYTVSSGDGTNTITLSNGTDLAGNNITSNPTSGATFTVDNTPT